jgi:hypothetical protein
MRPSRCRTRILVVVGDFEVRQRFVAAQLDLIPGDVIDPAGGFIDEVILPSSSAITCSGTTIVPFPLSRCLR